MKKVYVKPTTEAYELELQGMIADSATSYDTVNTADLDNEVKASKRGSWGSLW